MSLLSILPRDRLHTRAVASFEAERGPHERVGRYWLRVIHGTAISRWVRLDLLLAGTGTEHALALNVMAWQSTRTLKTGLVNEGNPFTAVFVTQSPEEPRS